MKKIFIAATVVLLAIGSLQAQTDNNNTSADKHAKVKQGRDAFKKLNLTDEQKKQFATAKSDYRKQLADVKNNKSLTADDQKKHAADLKKAQREKIKSLLTDDQKAKLATQKKEGRKGKLGKKGKKAGSV